MFSVFLLSAVVGGTLMACQFALTLAGLGGGSDFDADEHGDGLSGADAGHDATLGDHDAAGGDHGAAVEDQHHSSALFGILSFRTLVAALAFFGLAGLAALSEGWTVTQACVAAGASGFAAMYGVHSLMRGFTRLKSDGTVRLRDAVNQDGVVYLRIPGHGEGRGKIHVILKDQTVELQAETRGPAIPGGATVRVNEYLGGDAVSVERIDSHTHLATTPAVAVPRR